MPFEDIGIQKVLIEFHKQPEPGCYRIKRNCGMGCNCEAEMSRCFETPTLQDAGDDILCFNDAERTGIRGRDCTGRIIQDGPEIWSFEIDARLSRAVDTPPPAEPKSATLNNDIDNDDDCPF